jgi:sporulation protein YabP
METTLSLQNRELLVTTGIKKVLTTEPTQIVARLDNTTLVIMGQNLSVQNLSVREGVLEVVGIVTQIKYTNTHSKRFSLRNIFR